MRVLLVEDEQHLAQALGQMLRQNNYTVDLASDGEYGLDVLRQLREERVATPILLLSAKGETQDKVTGLDLGADDYLPKPFQTEELLARLRALCRRREPMAFSNVLTYGDLELNPNTLVLFCRGREYRLTRKEGQILELLMVERERFVSKGSIIEKVWGFDGETEDSHVEVYISFLRKKLKDLQAQVSIKTIRGVGYALQQGGGESGCLSN